MPRLACKARDCPGHCFASAFVPNSDENRDGGRSLLAQPRESRLRFAVPACIALQGGERADTVAICSCPQQDESRSGTCLAGQLHQARAPIAADFALAAPAPTPWPLHRTAAGALAEPSYNSKKPGLGQLIWALFGFDARFSALSTQPETICRPSAAFRAAPGSPFRPISGKPARWARPASDA
jgi:hypothetical protein